MLIEVSLDAKGNVASTEVVTTSESLRMLKTAEEVMCEISKRIDGKAENDSSHKK